jgi:hypothetical protein
MNKSIEFHFHPYSLEKGLHAVEKDMGDGRKRRYLKGVSSGLKTDGHEERMTQSCIKSFEAQARAGDIPLYAGKHGVNFFDDIGLLVDSEIEPNGDWLTTYRLYDESDGVGPMTLEIVDKIWKQVNGLPPYKAAKQKGFSIEGDIPDGGIASAVKDSQGNIGKRVINEVILDGVVLVNRPAYQDSIANAVYKALGESAPWAVKKSLQRSLQDHLAAEESKETYFRDYYRLQGAMDDEIRKVMALPEESRRPSLETLFSEFGTMMITLLETHPDVYAEQPDPDMIPAYKSADDAQYNVLIKLAAELQNLKKILDTPQKG